jgi:hypothetical protein
MKSRPNGPPAPCQLAQGLGLQLDPLQVDQAPAYLDHAERRHFGAGWRYQGTCAGRSGSGMP